MGRPKDDDLAIIDPYVQSLRRSHVEALRKFLNDAMSMKIDTPPCGHAEDMTPDEVKALREAADRLGCGPFAEPLVCDQCGGAADERMQMNHVSGITKDGTYQSPMWCETCAEGFDVCPDEFLNTDGTCSVCD